MKATVVATTVKIELEFSQRELELFHALVTALSGLKAEEVSGIERSAQEYTEMAYALSAAARTQIRLVESSGAERVHPKVSEVPS